VQIDRLRILLVHGTPRDPLDEYLFQDPASWEQRLQGTDCDLVCCGHTHVPFVLQAGAMHVLNPGSVGQPRDGDPRAAYAMIEDGRISLRRAEYDISAAVDQLRRAGAPPRTVELSEAVWRSGGQLFAGS
jgi:putative phosphoesterase